MGDLPRKKPRHPTSFRLTANALAKLDRLASHKGTNRTAVLEMLIRAAYRRLTKLQ